MLSLHREETPVILVALEGVDLQLREPPRRAGQEPAAAHDLVEEERVGPVQDREIDLLPGKESLKIRMDLRQLLQPRPFAIEEHAHVDVAPVVDSAVYAGVVIMVTATTVLTPPLLAWRLRRVAERQRARDRTSA